MTVVGGALLLILGLIVGGEDQSGTGAGQKATNPPDRGQTTQLPPKAEKPVARQQGRNKAKRRRHRGRGLRVYVSRVVDGDTIEVLMPSGRTEDIRYIGVDTPETVDPNEPVGCFGKKASNFNHRLVEGRRVRLVFDQERRDYYGRLLAYVYVGRTFVNATLLRRGLARAIYYSPNGAHRYEFESIARRAGQRGRGLWGACR